MGMIQTLPEIEAPLQAFINSTPSQLPTCTDGDGPLFILHARTDSGASNLQSHPLLLPLTTGHSQVSFQEVGSLLRETLKDRVLFQMNVHGCYFRNCTLISCTVHGGRFEECYFKDCQFAENVRTSERGNASNLTKAQLISRSHIENGSICDAEISSSTLKSINRLRDCELNNSLLVNCAARDSSFARCGVHESRLHECIVLDTVLTDSVISTKNTTTLRVFPAEIREMIYEDILEEDQTALTAAFRPDSLLYSEILEMCFRKHTFVLSRDNSEVLKSTPDAVRRRITKIRL